MRRKLRLELKEAVRRWSSEGAVVGSLEELTREGRQDTRLGTREDGS